MTLRPWQLSLIVLSLCAIALLVTFNARQERFSGHDWLFRRLSTDHAFIVGIDVDALRKAGLLDVLAGSRVNEELDYRRFVDQTAFDYRTDLDYVAASVSMNGDSKNFLLKGRFDWNSLYSTAKEAGGRCMNAFCDLPGFASGRNLSFLPVGPDALGMSITRLNQAAWGLASESTGVPLPRVPSYPVFLAMDAGILSSTEAVPLALRPLTEILSAADFVVLGVDAHAGGRLELALDADCMSEASAASIKTRVDAAATQGSAVLNLLRGGTVQVQGLSVHARWPLDRDGLQALITP
jgi:hypothetical protein